MKYVTSQQTCAELKFSTYDKMLYNMNLHKVVLVVEHVIESTLYDTIRQMSKHDGSHSFILTWITHNYMLILWLLI
jgi:hypothetical protein